MNIIPFQIRIIINSSHRTAFEEDCRIIRRKRSTVLVPLSILRTLLSVSLWGLECGYSKQCSFILPEGHYPGVFECILHWSFLGIITNCVIFWVLYMASSHASDSLALSFSFFFFFFM